LARPTREENQKASNSTSDNFVTFDHCNLASSEHAEHFWQEPVDRLSFDGSPKEPHCAAP